MKKEELIIEITRLRKSHEEWVAGDTRRRKEFAKAFGWRLKKPYYESEAEYSTPSWEEIFTKIGGLLCAESMLHDSRRLEALENSLKVLHEELEAKNNQ